MRVSDLRYDLPEQAIAQHPIEPRDAARLLVAGPDNAVTHTVIRALPSFVQPGDLLVVNDTKVLPARLHLHKESGGAAEVLLLSPRDGAHRTWEALVRPGKRLPPGTPLLNDTGDVVVEVGAVLSDDGIREVVVVGATSADEADAIVRDVGVMPLPPYIHETLDDPQRYQTVYARVAGSVAAPTAGLHFTEAVMQACRDRGAAIAAVTLDVGLGTFRPMATDNVEDHVMHHERYVVPDTTIEAIAKARRVIAVGTTSLRTLESWAASGEASGSTGLFIYGDYKFQVVDRLLTNFHLPGSSLLALLDAFTSGAWKGLYRRALDEGYRFLSFGDAMLVDRAN